MTTTPRLDTIVADGTEVFERIRLADGHALTLKVQPGADHADEVFLFPGLTAPDTEAWENEDPWEEWLTGGSLDGGALFLEVPVQAVHDLIEQHGGEHEDQEGGDSAPQTGDETDEDETAETLATRALAAWGITAHLDDDCGNTWLIVGYDQDHQGFPRMHAAPYVVLYLYEGPDDEEITVDRAPATGDIWQVVAGDGTCAERTLMVRPADQLTDCVTAIAEWITTPQTSPDPLTQLADLGGCFEGGGVTPEAVRSAFGRIADEGGPYLVCVWEYADQDGFGGNSQFYAEDTEGNLFEVQPDIYQWLNGELETPGALETWVCAPVAEPIEFATGDDRHNYALAELAD